MKFRKFLTEQNMNESEMKYQALSMAKELHSQLAELTFIEMLSMMSPDNPAKKEVQALETELNDLTNKVGDFIQKYIPDVSDAEAGDHSEEPEPDDDEDDKNNKDKKDKKPKKPVDK